MKALTEKPVAELTTDELGHAYADRLLTEGVEALDAGASVEANHDFFDGLRQHVRMIAAQANSIR